MTAAYFEDHPTDPDKAILRKPRLDQGPDYERGFIDGMMYQVQTSVYKAVNRLAQTEQEPVGYLSEGGAERLTTVKQAHEQIRSFRLFTHDVPLYTTPPQRPWVGLTDEEIRSIAKPTDDTEILMTGRMWIFVGDLMEKLKEKNT